MLLDANVLLYAVDATDARHATAVEFLESALNGTSRVAFPWQSITAFIRISTHPRVALHPLSAEQAAGHIDAWLSTRPAWIPAPTAATASILSDLLRSSGATGNLVSDAALAAIAIEHSIPVITNDSDFHRFPVTIVNPFE